METLLSESSRSVVYKINELSDKQSSICKMCSPSKSSKSELLNEYEITKLLNIKGIRSPLNKGLFQNKEAVFYDYFEGISLKKYITTNKVSIKEFLSIAIKIANILHQLHNEGVIHLRINSNNILYNSDNGEVLLIDFSLAIKKPINKAPDFNEWGAELAYIAPEQTGHLKKITDNRTDLYSLGVVLYELWSGQTPFVNAIIAEMIHQHLVKVPPPLKELREDTPEVISQIIDKLLNKSPDARYQTAAGLEFDLKECNYSLAASKKLQNFKLGTKDYPDHINLSNNFYGRQKELTQLINCFENIKDGGNELLFISGETGIGKTSFVQQFGSYIEEQSGILISGKFGQQNLQLPNRAMVQALKGLAAFILSQTDTKLEEWKELLVHAVDDIGQLLVEIIPEYEWIIGKQNPIPELNANQLESRVNFLFLRLIETIATPEHPLVLFIDDIQWADTSSWKSLQSLLSGNDIAHFMFICSYRVSEIEHNHALNHHLNELLNAKVNCKKIVLNNLELDEIEAFINDSFPADHPKELSQIVYNKTFGNPFFVRKFIISLHQRKIIHFIPELQKWVWDSDSISSVQMADNVIDYMNEKVKRLPLNVLKTLMVASCVGNHTKVAMLCSLLDISKEEIEKDLAYYVSENLLEKEKYDEYRFVHDRIQQTSHELLPEEEKGIIHYKIAGLLVGEQNSAADAKQMFTIASNYNVGYKQILPEERISVAQLNYKVGLEAKKSASFELAFSYFESALKLVNENDWESNYDLMLHLHNEATACGMIVGEYPKANEYLKISLLKAKNFNDRIKAHEIKLVHLSETHQFPETVAHLLEVLEEIGYGIKRFPSKFSILKEFIKVKMLFIGKKIADIPNLPEMQDERAKAFLKFSGHASVSIFGTAPDILPIINFRQIYLSLKYGNSEYSPHSYATYGFAISVFMNDAAQGYELSKMALRLVDKMNVPVIKAKVMVIHYAFLSFWKDALVESVAPLREAYYIGRQTGDILYASFAASFCNHVRLFTGDNLAEILESMTEDCITIKSLKQELVYIISECQRQYVICLTQNIAEPWVLKNEGFDEFTCMEQLKNLGDTASIFNLFFYKLALAGIFNEYELGYEYNELVSKYEEQTTSRQTIYPTYLFFSAMIGIKQQGIKNESEIKKISSKVLKKIKILKSFSKLAPQNYENKCCLLEAFLLEKEGKIVETTLKYQEAINLSNKSGFVHEEAISREHFAYFLFKIGQSEFGEVMLQKAFECYKNWGADNKCFQLRKNFPSIVGALSNSANDNTIAGFQNIYDLNTIIKANQVLSSENSLEGLLRKMVELVISNASSSKVVIIIKNKKQEFLPYAIGTNESIRILSEENMEFNQFPQSIIQYVLRSKTEFVSPNLSNDKSYNFDPYVKIHHPVSVCCMPIVTKETFLGVLYFENNLTEFVFDKKRVEFFKTIAGQLAISLENVMLYKEMDQKVKDRTSELGEKNFELTKEKKKSDDLLLNILPAETADELKNFGKTTAKRYEEVTILFSDIKDFTKISEILTPEELVSELDICFKKFDEITIQNGLEKIKTIGDAYISVGGLPISNKATAHDVVRCALQMQEFMKIRGEERKNEGKPFFQMRVGINTGSVVSGVVGIKKFQFDIWGDAVNIAARMEQYSEVGKVNLSEATYKLVKDHYHCLNRGKVLAKGKGETNMYFVVGNIE